MRASKLMTCNMNFFAYVYSRCASMHQMLVCDLLAFCVCNFLICMRLCLCVKAGQCYLDLSGKDTSKLGHLAVLLANNRYIQRYS